jgi:tRNA (cmo5U34)-methyltransferase
MPNNPASPFSTPAAVANYAAGPPRMVPGFADMQRMTAILLAERVPAAGRVLVVGAGGGLELQAFAKAHPGWTFDGVDPSADMLRLAEQTLGPLAPRVRLHEGTIDAAPAGPFDGATCLLTMHYVDPVERLRQTAEIHRRLKPGAPLVVVHFSLPADTPSGSSERTLWLTRYAAFAAASGVPKEKAEAAATAVSTHLHILTPDEDEALLHTAGFREVKLFYAAFAFRGWVAHA